MSRIILTDVHGCYKTLLALVAKLPTGIPLTFAGDLIDRGPDSRKVIEFVKNGGHDCVLGNHEVMMINELKIKENSDGSEVLDPYSYSPHSPIGIWGMNGGDTTVDSYSIGNGKHDIAAIKEHAEWLNTLPHYLEYPDLKDAQDRHLLVTHSTAAYVWDDVPRDSAQFKDNVLWERTPFPAKIDGIFNVYGHTPQKNGATVKDHFACIDGGCYVKRQPYGKLFALQWPEMVLFSQDNVE